MRKNMKRQRLVCGTKAGGSQGLTNEDQFVVYFIYIYHCCCCCHFHTHRQKDGERGENLAQILFLDCDDLSHPRR